MTNLSNYCNFYNYSKRVILGLFFKKRGVREKRGAILGPLLGPKNPPISLAPVKIIRAGFDPKLRALFGPKGRFWPQNLLGFLCKVPKVPFLGHFGVQFLWVIPKKKLQNAIFGQKGANSFGPFQKLYPPKNGGARKVALFWKGGFKRF